MADATIQVAGTAAIPLDYTVPNAQEITPLTAFGVFNGAAAASAFRPCLRIKSPGGLIVAEIPTDITINAGSSGDATWAPFLRQSEIVSRGLPTVGVTDSPAGTSAGSGVETAIRWTTIAFDTNGMWSAANPTRLTCVENGFYYITANCFWGANAAGYRRIRVRQNGGPTVLVGDSRMAVTVAGVETDQNAPKATWQAVIGDYVECMALQNSGGPLTGFFAVTIFKVSETQL